MYDMFILQQSTVELDIEEKRIIISFLFIRYVTARVVISTQSKLSPWWRHMCLNIGKMRQNLLNIQKKTRSKLMENVQNQRESHLDNQNYGRELLSISVKLPVSFNSVIFREG